MPAFYDGELFTVNVLQVPASDPIIAHNSSLNIIYATNDLDDEQDFVPVIGQNFFEICHEHLPDQSSCSKDSILRRDEDQFGRFERIPHGDGHTIRVDPVSFSIPIKTERRHNRQDSLIQQRLQQFHIHALDFAGEQVVNTLNDAQRMRDDRVSASGSKIVGGQSLQDLMGQTIGSRQRELERSGIRDPCPIEI